MAKKFFSGCEKNWYYKFYEVLDDPMVIYTLHVKINNEKFIHLSFNNPGGCLAYCYKEYNPNKPKYSQILKETKDFVKWLGDHFELKEK